MRSACRGLLAAVAVFSLAGCPPPPPPDVVIDVIGTAEMAPGEASGPVEVRVRPRVPGTPVSLESYRFALVRETEALPPAGAPPFAGSIPYASTPMLTADTRGFVGTFSPEGTAWDARLSVTAPRDARRGDEVGRFQVVLQEPRSGLMTQGTRVPVEVLGADFRLTASPPTVALARGGLAVFTVAIDREAEFSGPVQLEFRSALDYRGEAETNLHVELLARDEASASATVVVVETLGASVGGAPGDTIRESTLTFRALSATTTRRLTVPVSVSGVYGAPFWLSANPTSLLVRPGGSATADVVLGSMSSFGGAVDLSTLALPAGLTVAFDPPSLGGRPSVGASHSTATITTSSTTPPGVYVVEFLGAARGGSSAALTNVVVTVAGARADGGDEEPDAGEPSDAGELPDAGEPVDAGEPADAGASVDAGSSLDAGPPGSGPHLLTCDCGGADVRTACATVNCLGSFELTDACMVLCGGATSASPVTCASAAPACVGSFDAGEPFDAGEAPDAGEPNGNAFWCHCSDDRYVGLCTTAQFCFFLPPFSPSVCPDFCGQTGATAVSRLCENQSPSCPPGVSVFAYDGGASGLPLDAGLPPDAGPADAGWAPVAIAAGWTHVCALMAGGEVYCWGKNPNLGDPSLASPRYTFPVRVENLPPVVQVVSGSDSSCALTDGGEVFCFGPSVPRLNATQPDGGTWGPGRADAGGLTFSHLAMGGSTLCGDLADGGFVCWGGNDQGALGRGFASTFDPVPALPDGGAGLRGVSLGDRNGCALDSASMPWCWGLLPPNTSFNAAPRPGSVALEALASGFSFACGLSPATKIPACFGANNRAQTGAASPANVSVPTTVAGAPAMYGLALGEEFACGLSGFGTAWCWGSQNGGRLGNGLSTSGSVPTPTAVLGGNFFSQVSAGRLFACGLTPTGRILCWGSNTEGQLCNSASGTAAVAIPAEIIR